MNKLGLLSLLIICLKVYSNTFYLDPVNGSNSGTGTISNPWKTLEYVINNNLIESKSYVTPYDPNNPQLVVKNSGAPIKSGDTLMLYSGLHGNITLVNYINDNNITVMNVAGNTPIFEKLHIQAGKNWVFKGIEISSEPYGAYLNNKLVFLESHNWQGVVSNIIIEDCHIYSTTTPWTIASEWVNKASDGIYINSGTNFIEVRNNFIENIHFGIRMQGNFLTVSGNTIKNFSADGIRLVGSNNIVEKNTIKNCYDVDNNHDDGIQAFTTGGFVVDNNIIRQNVILNYEDPNQPLLGDLQGIGCFDGPVNNWIVENNLVIVNHWHGISLYGATNCSIINNTVLDPAPTTGIGPSWIKIADANGLISSNCIVKNNVTNTITVTPNTTVGNNTTLQTLADYSLNFVDYVNYDFHLRQASPLIDAADSSVAPTVDIEGNLRPSGQMPDIGAYEYMFSLSIKKFTDKEIQIFPNPFNHSTTFHFPKTFPENTLLKIYNVFGQLVRIETINSKLFTFKRNNLKSGTYYFHINSYTGIMIITN